MMRRNSDVLKKSQERRKQQDEAPRLLEIVPNLLTLVLRVEEERPDLPSSGVAHKRHIVVQRAPALFDIPCSDRRCSGGGHDVTKEVLRQLRRGEQSFVGGNRCTGERKDGACDYQLNFVAEAAFGA